MVNGGTNSKCSEDVRGFIIYNNALKMPNGVFKLMAGFADFLGSTRLQSFTGFALPCLDGFNPTQKLDLSRKIRIQIPSRCQRTRPPHPHPWRTDNYK